MVATFSWAAILAETLEDREQRQHHLWANARLLAHMVEHIFWWRQFHQACNVVPEFTSSQCTDFTDFTERCDVDMRAEILLILWGEHGVDTDATPHPAV